MKCLEVRIGLSATVVATAVIGLALLLYASGASASEDGRSDPTCTPDIVYTAAPGVVDASGSGSGDGLLEANTPAGDPMPDTFAHVEWEYRAIVRDEGVPQRLGGFIDLRITTESGDSVTFTSECMAGVGTFGLEGVVGYAIIYANGRVTGWPGVPANGARKALVHFEVANFSDGTASAYVAIVGGKDCSLNFDALLVTPDGIPGIGESAGEPDGFVYSETNCAKSKSGHRFNSPHWSAAGTTQQGSARFSEPSFEALAVCWSIGGEDSGPVMNHSPV